MIAAIARHRFMNTEQVCRLFACNCPRVEKDGMRAGVPVKIQTKQHRDNCACSCSAGQSKREHAAGCPALFKDDQHVGHRLLELYQAGYLERPVSQLQLRVKNGVIGKGSVPMVYRVTTAGLGVIGEERRHAIGHGKMSWVGENIQNSRLFMEHTLAIADVSVGVDVAVRERTHVARLEEAKLYAGLSKDRQEAVRPWSLKVKYQGKELSTVCDLVFVLGDASVRKRYNYMTEVDLGHMPVERATLTRTSIMRKLIGYAKAHAEGLHRTEFGWDNFRVLILTTSSGRVRSCVAAARKQFGSASVGRIFLFGTLEASHDMFNHEFVDIDSKQVRLMR